MKAIKLTFTFILILGAIVAAFLFINGGGTPPPPPLSQTALEDYRKQFNTDKKLLAEDFFIKAESVINKEDVTFDKIDSLYEESKEFKDYDASGSVYNIIKTYHDLVALIRSGKIDLAKIVARGKYITPEHANQVRKLNNANWKQVKSFDEIKSENTASDSKPVGNSNGENKGDTNNNKGNGKNLDPNTERSK